MIGLSFGAYPLMLKKLSFKSVLLSYLLLTDPTLLMAIHLL